MTIVHLTISFIVAITMGVLYTLTVQSGKQLSPSLDYMVLELILPIIGVASFFGARYLINKRMKQIAKDEKLSVKLEAYKSGMVILWAMLTGTALFGAVLFYLSGRLNLLLYGLMAGVFILYFRPLKTKIARDFGLSPEEKEQLN
jgi:4-hydroxybenzoate polyprenyltransferase